MLDPAADPGRQVWAACPNCGAPEGWCWLLDALGGRLVWAQCPGCEHRWHHDTQFGAEPVDRAIAALSWPLT